MECPICGCEAADAGARDYGDKSRLDCPRCGRYEISGTALAMLASRLSADRLASARLSHAVRHEPRREGEWLMVNSANLDTMAARPLPDVRHALANVRAWLAAQLGEDRFGAIPLPDPAHLAAVAGVPDGDAVRLLLKHAAEHGEMESEDGRLRLTPQGWAALPPRPAPEPAREEPPAPAAPAAPAAADKVEQANCNTCGGDRNAFVRTRFEKPGSDGEVSWHDTMEILECCGCGSLSVRRRYWFSEWDTFGNDSVTGEQVFIPGVEETSWPPKNSRKKPVWADRVEDDTLRAVLDEVYSALAQGLRVLAAIGTRTLIDRTVVLAVDEDKGPFPAKLDAMAKAGKMGAGEKDVILAIADVGNAAAHRGFCPDAKTLDAVLTAAEAVIYREFILPRDAAAVRKATPRKGD